MKQRESPMKQLSKRIKVGSLHPRLNKESADETTEHLKIEIGCGEGT